MSRPTREESIYQISIHRNGGYMYASTHPYTTDEKTGKRKYVNPLPLNHERVGKNILDIVSTLFINSHFADRVAKKSALFLTTPSES